MRKAVVVFSGGQDSTTCLGWALKNFDEVEAITFNYGQKHSIELEQAKSICEKHGVNQTLIDISFLNTLVDSALTSNGDVNKTHPRLKYLPASFVPNRNALFLTLAHAYAQKIGAETLVTGVCETDYCVTGDTLIDCPRDLSIYPQGIPIKELVGKEFLTWSWDVQKQKTVLKRAFNVRKTYDETDIYEVKYTWGVGKSKRFGSVKATSDHRFLLTSGKYVKLKDLKNGDSLQPFHSTYDKKYRLITSEPTKVQYEHKLIVSLLNNINIASDWVSHHKDHNPYNNNVDNLQKMDFSIHMSHHTKQSWESGLLKVNNTFINNNPMNYKKYRDKVSQKKKEWWDNLLQEDRQRMSNKSSVSMKKRMESNDYINPSNLPGVKFKQRYARYKYYNNRDGMEMVKKEAEIAGFSVNHKVVSIEYIGRDSAYDMEVEDTHNFVANDIFIHNSGYPDCRNIFIESLQESLHLASDVLIKIETPLMYLDKADTFKMADDIGILNDVINLSHTCYNGDHKTKNEWGYGCGECPACQVRKRGYEEYLNRYKK